MVVGGYSANDAMSESLWRPRSLDEPEISVVPSRRGWQVVQDDVDRSTDFMVLTPAFAKKVLNIVSGETYGVHKRRCCWRP